MNIRQYASELKKQALEDVEGRPSDHSIRAAFDRGGYHSVVLGYSGHLQWQAVHTWCVENFGQEHYTWTGSRFWFENDSDAALFALKWL